MKKYLYKTVFLFFISSVLVNAVETNNYIDNPATKQQSTNTEKQEDKYIIQRTLNGKVFQAKIPESIINIYKLNPNDFIVPAKYLFLEPIVLLLLNDLTNKVIDVFNKVNLSYWAYGNTGASINTFASFMPWDPDSYLAVDVDQWQEKLTEITNLLQKNGIVFFLDRNQANKKFNCELEFEFKSFSDLVQTYEPLFTKEHIKELYKKITDTFIKPKLKIIPFSISESGVKNYISHYHTYYVKNGGGENGYNNSSIFPLVPKQMNNFNINTMNKSDIILKDHIDYFHDFELWVGICTNCTTLKIGDISKHKDFLSMINDYLTFVFKDKFSNPSLLHNLIYNQ